LLSARPDFIDMFVQIGRVGRSLGIHLLLASQRLEEGRLRGLETHLSYRLGLRTFSSMESRTVLGVPDAYELPRAPGHGYLKAGTEGLIRFKAAYVSGVHRPGEQRRAVGAGAFGDMVQMHTTHYIPPATEESSVPQIPKDDEGVPQGDTLLDVLVHRIEGQGPAAHQVWLPPLNDSPSLDELLPAVVSKPRRGLTVRDDNLHGALHAVVGIVDKPFEQRRDPMWLDLSGAAGNVVLVGGAQSGKSTLVRALLVSLALTHTPQEVQFYCLDFGGGGLNSLQGLPHVGSIAARRDVNRVRRTLSELRAVIEAREARFAADGVDSIATYRRLKREGRYSDDHGDAFLVVDGWLTLRNEFEDLEAVVMDVVNRGLGYGVHIVATANRWMDLRANQRDMFGSKIELRLGDPGDSLINRRSAVNVPEQRPGHGLTPDGHHFLGGLPRIDGRSTVDDLAEGVRDLVKACQVDWSAAPAPSVRLLPDILAFEALPKPVPGGGGKLAIGIAETDLQPLHLDFDAEPHLVLFGDVECGKSSFLRSLARSIVDGYSSYDAKVILVDQRRSLLGCIATDHLIGYGTSTAVTADLIAQVATVMRSRLPGPDVTAEQLGTRSWWSGLRGYVLVDDYDLVAGAATNPLLPLLEFIPQARDLGLHIVLTRRVGARPGAVRQSSLEFVSWHHQAYSCRAPRRRVQSSATSNLNCCRLVGGGW
jgi:S-DNA-T family DNA segregation ATPase FtsK/SpoIIIE